MSDWSVQPLILSYLIDTKLGFPIAIPLRIALLSLWSSGIPADQNYVFSGSQNSVFCCPNFNFWLYFRLQNF